MSITLEQLEQRIQQLEKENKELKKLVRQSNVYVDQKIAEVQQEQQEHQQNQDTIERNLEDVIRLVVRNFPRQNNETNQVVEDRIKKRFLDVTTFTYRTKFKYL